MNYSLIRSKRKTVTIYVREDCVEVRAPLHMPKYMIDRFVTSKEKWIEDKQSRLIEQAKKREGFRLDYGSLLTYRGGQYPVAAKEGVRAGFDGARFYMPAGLSPERIKAACVQIYRLLAKRDLTERARLFAQQMSVTPAAIRITGARTRWGSCSARKSISFSWYLMMAGDDLIDYVVVHELAHIAELNHSDRFWAIVAGAIPDWRERRAKLKELQRKLSGEDWEA